MSCRFGFLELKKFSILWASGLFSWSWRVFGFVNFRFSFSELKDSRFYWLQICSLVSTRIKGSRIWGELEVGWSWRPAIEELAAWDMDSVLHTSRGGLVLVVTCGWMSLLFLVSFLGNLGPVSSAGGDVAAAAAPSAMTPPTECSMPSDMMVSGSNCSYYDEQSMAGLMGGCREFLTNTENAPTQDCCFGVNQVAYARTPCFCKATFYPLDSAVDASADVNVTRQKLLPGLCLVTLDLCNLCLDFVSPLGTGVPSPGEWVSNVLRSAVIPFTCWIKCYSFLLLTVVHRFFAYDGTDDDLLTNLWADILHVQQDRVPNCTGQVWQYWNYY